MNATPDRWLSATALAAGAVGFGYALQLTNGTLDRRAILWLTVTIGLTALALTRVRLPFIERWGDRLAVTVLGAGLVLEFAIRLTTPPGVYLRVAGDAFLTHHYWVAAAAVLAGAALSKSPWLGRLTIPLLLLTHFMLGLWLLKASPSPVIDVWVWHREAFQALGRGENPYSISMPNIYGHTLWYAPGLATNTTVDVGYPYPPLSLLLAAPGHLIAGDYRYANLVAITASGALMAYARPGRLATAAAAVFLFTPRGLFVLEQGWTEANVILVLSATVFVACRAPRLLPYAIGLLFAVKQYFVLTAPLALFFLPRPLRWADVARFYGKAALVALVITAPLALWDPSGFFRSVVAFQGKQPFRADALSYLAWFAKDGQPGLPMWLSFAMVLPALGLAFWRAARTPAGYAAGTALVFLLFFGFAKQAFCNYYFLVVGALCCAAAAVRPPEAEGAVSLASPAAAPAATAAVETPPPPS